MQLICYHQVAACKLSIIRTISFRVSRCIYGVYLRNRLGNGILRRITISSLITMTYRNNIATRNRCDSFVRQRLCRLRANRRRPRRVSWFTRQITTVRETKTVYYFFFFRKLTVRTYSTGIERKLVAKNIACVEGNYRSAKGYDSLLENYFKYDI